VEGHEGPLALDAEVLEGDGAVVGGG
jgi:hypothetical protein